MGEPASNLPVGIRKLDLAVLVLLLIVWVGRRRVGRVVRKPSLTRLMDHDHCLGG